MLDAPSGIDKIFNTAGTAPRFWTVIMDMCLHSVWSTSPIPSNPPLPFEIVPPIEDLLQQGDHGKGADEDEEQSSVSQQIPAWRRVCVSHPEAPLGVKFSSLSLSCTFHWEAEGNACCFFSEQSKDRVSHFLALLPLPCPLLDVSSSVVHNGLLPR